MCPAANPERSSYISLIHRIRSNKAPCARLPILSCSSYLARVSLARSKSVYECFPLPRKKRQRRHAIQHHPVTAHDRPAPIGCEYRRKRVPLCRVYRELILPFTATTVDANQPRLLSGCHSLASRSLFRLRLTFGVAMVRLSRSPASVRYCASRSPESNASVE